MAGEREMKHLRGDELDRLSELPDSLILQILSLLEMKEVVNTGILSKRWKSLWKQVDRVVYKFNDDKGLPRIEYLYMWMERNRQKLHSFVNTTLRQHDSNIKEFVMDAYHLLDDNRYADLMDDWIRCVLEKKVEVFKFSNEGIFSYAPPDCLFQCSSLTELELKSLDLFKLSVAVRWNLLNSLCLESIRLSDESMENILSGCTVLESLVLKNIYVLERINITSPSVVKLKLDGVWTQRSNDFNDVFRIRAPWVKELEISGRFLVINCQIEDFSSLLKANLMLTAYDSYSWKDELQVLVNRQMAINAKWINDMAPRVLKAFSHVAELSIGTELIQVLSLSKLYGKPSPSFQCKHLTINSPLWNYDVFGIACLLENAPHLETLVINVSNQQVKGPFNETKLFDYEDIDLSLPKGNYAHLKNVKIDYNQSSCFDNPAHVGGYCNDVEIVRYIMRSAAALERLVLCSSRPGCTRSGCSKANCTFLYVPRLSTELQTKFLLVHIEAEEWELKKRKYSYEYRFSNYDSLCSEIDSEVASC